MSPLNLFALNPLTQIPITWIPLAPVPFVLMPLTAIPFALSLSKGLTGLSRAFRSSFDKLRTNGKGNPAESFA